MRRSLLRIALVLALACAATPLALAKSLDVSLSAPKAFQKLNAFRSYVRTAAAQGKRPVVVLDFDDTLVRLFSNQQVPGACQFVNGVLSDGARVIYQCGRKESQRPQLMALLGGCGIPVNDNAQLWLKPNKEKAKTVEWKKSQKPQIQAFGLPVGFFDNEKVNIRMFRKEFPKSWAFRLNTTSYFPDPGGTGTIWVIDDFCPSH